MQVVVSTMNNDAAIRFLLLQLLKLEVLYEWNFIATTSNFNNGLFIEGRKTWFAIFFFQTPRFSTFQAIQPKNTYIWAVWTHWLLHLRVIFTFHGGIDPWIAAFWPGPDSPKVVQGPKKPGGTRKI